MIFEKKDTLVMIGDSVTDCGRHYDYAIGGYGSFGDGYVYLVDSFLSAMYPELNLLIANKGISGNRIADLYARWDEDVMELKPDWVSVMVGINDVWREFEGILRPRDLSTVAEYEVTYRKIIEKTLPHVKGMILMSPFMMEVNEEHPMKKRVREYIAVVEKLATEYNLIYIDNQSRFDKFLSEACEFVITQDRVHPNHKGHAIIAKGFLDSVGIDWTK